MKNFLDIKAGDIAKNKNGELGLILNNMPQSIEIVDDEGKVLGSRKEYTGIYLENNENVRVGDFWSSFEPIVVGNISEAIGSLNSRKELEKLGLNFEDYEKFIEENKSEENQEIEDIYKMISLWERGEFTSKELCEEIQTKLKH